MRTNKTCYACLSFSSSALLAIFLQLECLFVFFARKAVYWIVFWKSNCLTFCRFIWKLIFWLLRRKVTQLFVFWLLDFLREKSKSRKIRKVSKSYFLTFWAVFSKVTFWLFARKVTFWLFEFFFEKLLFDFLREKWLFDFLSFFFEKLLFDFLREKLLFDFLFFFRKVTFWLFARKVTFWLFARKVTFWLFELFFEKLLFDFLREKWLLDFLSLFSKRYFLTFLREKWLFDFLRESDFLTFWVFFWKVTFWLFARKVTFWLFELFFKKLLFDFLREKWLFDFLSFFFEKLLFDFLREKLLFDFLTFCAKSAYSRSKAFLRRERRLAYSALTEYRTASGKFFKLWQGVVEERRLLQTYGFPFVEGPWFKKDLMVPRHYAHTHRDPLTFWEWYIMEPKYYMRFGGD